MSFTKSIANQIYTIKIDLDANEATIYRGRESGMSDTKPIFDDDDKLDYTIGSTRYYIQKKDAWFYNESGMQIRRDMVVNAVAEVITDICKKLEKKIKPKFEVEKKVKIAKEKSDIPYGITSLVDEFKLKKTIRLECTSGGHNKFWEVKMINNRSYLRRWGKIGSYTPSSKEFSFMSTEQMIKDFQHELSAKLSKAEDAYHVTLITE
jgi:predicted DNA-binding WGR domain protein